MNLQFPTPDCQTDVIAITKKCEECGAKFSEKLKELRNACKSRSAVPVDQIYVRFNLSRNLRNKPIFIAVSQVWEAWKDNLCMLQFFAQVFENLRLMANSISEDDTTYPDRDDVSVITGILLHELR